MGWKVNRKKVERLRKALGLVTIYPKPNLSKPRQDHKKYPYLLKDLEIICVNQVWSTDITYVRIKGRGWVYVVAVLDWFSRYVLSFEISISQEVDFCLLALETALQRGTPEIFNSDQGSQFTSNEFVEILEGKEIKISMDSKGRALDNIRTERFCRSLKYEEVFLKEYESVNEAKESIKDYIQFYNNERIHHKKISEPSLKKEVFIEKQKYFKFFLKMVLTMGYTILIVFMYVFICINLGRD